MAKTKIVDSRNTKVIGNLVGQVFEASKLPIEIKKALYRLAELSYAKGRLSCMEEIVFSPPFKKLESSTQRRQSNG